MANYPSVLPTIYESLMESQYWTVERRTEAQRRNLAALIRFARAQVPFYKTRLDALFTPTGDIDWDRWNEVPIVTRRDMVEAGETLLPDALPPGHGQQAETDYTSGSTGAPLKVVQSQLSNVVLTASLYRAHRWHNLDWSRDVLFWFGEHRDRGLPPDGDTGAIWGPGWVAGATGRTVNVNRFTAPDDMLKVMQRRGISYLAARPMAAQSAALEAMRLGLDVKIDAIQTFGTGIRPDQRADCRAAFGARMIAPYSAKEGQFMAHQCPSGTHFHVNEEAVLVEIVDHEGRPCAVGETGRVIVTPIFNFAQPLIRYEQGDLASFGPPCGCGRTLRVIAEISGRVTHLFRLPDGRRLSFSLGIEMQQALGSKYWQIAQVEPLLLEVRYVPLSDATGDEEVVVEAIRAKLGADMQVKFSRRTDLNRADGQKFIEYVCELPA